MFFLSHYLTKYQKAFLEKQVDYVLNKPLKLRTT